MLISIAIANIALSILCFYGVWRVGRVRRALMRVTGALDRAEQETKALLHHAPEAIDSKQITVAQLSHLLRQVGPAIRQAKQLLMLVGLVRGMLPRSKPKKRRLGQR